MAMEPQFDPALKELLLRHSGHHLGEHLDRDAGPEIPVVIRLRRPGAVIPGIREVARLGPILTARVPIGSIVPLRRHPLVASLKASTLYVGDLSRSLQDIRATPARLPIRGKSPLDGRGVTVAVLDWGFDFVHRAFRTAAGGSRIRWLWDQRGGAGDTSPEPYGYGREFSRERIEAALRAADPYAALDYDPADAAAGNEGTHGTHVASIAAGSGPLPGVAPGADLIFVHLKGGDTSPRDTLGDSVRLLEAVDYVLGKVGDGPVVFNLSLGRTGDSKDGTSPVEQALDAVLRDRPGTVICMSAGNYYRSRMHASGMLGPGGRRNLYWVVPPMRRDVAEMEIWYPGEQRLWVELIDPEGRRVARVSGGDSAIVREQGRLLVSVYHRLRDPNNGDNQVDIFLHPGARAGRWQVVLGTVRGKGRFHAWIERTRPSSQSRFSVGQADPLTTIGTICTGRRTLACAAYDATAPERPIAPFSSAGPTRDGRQVPVLAAPGVRIRAARSSAPDVLGLRALHRYGVKSGTSMAAPHCTGVAALMMQAALPRLPDSGEIRAILRATARRPARASRTFSLRYGAGLLDARAAVSEVLRRYPPRRTSRAGPEARQATMEKITMSNRMQQTLRHQDSGEGTIWAEEESLHETVRAGEALPLPFDAERPPPHEEVDEQAPLPARPDEGWVVPPQVLAAGQRQRVRYDDAPLWTGTGRECSGVLSPGARRLRCHLLQHFPGIRAIGGYNCRRNTADRRRLSIHGTGRALDIMIPMQGRAANHRVGDPIAAWLIRNAETLGVQYLIWDRVRWSGHRRPRFARYTGPHPQDAHLHVEGWTAFSGPPAGEGCEASWETAFPSRRNRIRRPGTPGSHVPWRSG